MREAWREDPWYSIREARGGTGLREYEISATWKKDYPDDRDLRRSLRPSPAGLGDNVAPQRRCVVRCRINVDAKHGLKSCISLSFIQSSLTPSTLLPVSTYKIRTHIRTIHLSTPYRHAITTITRYSTLLLSHLFVASPIIKNLPTRLHHEIVPSLYKPPCPELPIRQINSVVNSVVSWQFSFSSNLVPSPHLHTHHFSFHPPHFFHGHSSAS
jgi:hypothetical protein